MIAYVDSSVLMRRVLGQSPRLSEYGSIKHAVASALVELECLRTLDRLRHTQQWQSTEMVVHQEAVYRAIEHMEVVSLSRAVLERAKQPLPVPLGSLDALHLSTALLWREEQQQDLVLATHDAGLGLAARACGLLVIGT